MSDGRVLAAFAADDVVLRFFLSKVERAIDTVIAFFHNLEPTRSRTSVVLRSYAERKSDNQT